MNQTKKNKNPVIFKTLRIGWNEEMEMNGKNEKCSHFASAFSSAVSGCSAVGGGGRSGECV